MARAALRGPLAWPLPALLGWAAAWAACLATGAAGLSAPWAGAAGLGIGLGAAALERVRWRRLAIATGFPLSYALAGHAVALPAWAWLLALAALALAYPIGAWRDAPLFPTPPDALDGLARAVPLPRRACVLDAGCGLGHALVALRRAYPHAELHGIERSAPLAPWCAWRRRDARVARGDMWRRDWSPYDLVYLFQRPETLPRALEKARRELRAGAWLASLEFEAPGVPPTRRLTGADGRPLWLYRMP